MNRLAVLHRERAALFAKLAELEAEIAAVLAEWQTANDAAPVVKRPRPARPEGLPPRVRVPEGVTVSETAKAKAGAALRRLGYRTRPDR